MSPDLKLATVYVMPLGGKDTEPVLAALERNKRYIRGEVAHAVNLKFAPDIRFRATRRSRRRAASTSCCTVRKVRRDVEKRRKAWHAARRASPSTAGWCSTSRSA